MGESAILLVIALFLSFLRGEAVEKEIYSNENLIQYVNPFIGTGGWVDAYPGDSVSYDEIRKNPGHYAFGGLTYPGAVAPFGMLQLSPDCNTDGFGWSAGYHYSDYSILGFSHNHTSGNGMGFGHYLFMPCTGPVFFDPGDYRKTENGYRSRFSHVRETATPGYYSVFLDDYNIKVELTVTERVGMHRYSFPEKQARHIIVDLAHGLGEYANPKQAGIKKESDTSISGYRLTDNGVKSYFYAEFSKPFDRIIWEENGVQETRLDNYSGKNVKSAIFFDDVENSPIMVKVAVSFTSLENAKNNMRKEIPHWNFDEVVENTKENWNRALSKIKVNSSDYNAKVSFYTALYHSTLTPFLFNDANGDFLGADGRVHNNRKFKNYTFFTLWDTYRSLHPLLTIIRTDMINDVINSMLCQADLSENHLLPLWCLAGRNSYNMAGYSFAPVIAEAILKGFKGFDRKKALRYMVDNAISVSFSGHDDYKEKGYVPADKVNMSVPKTLEYAFCDWNIAMVAKELGDSINYHLFKKQSNNYKQVFDTSSGFMRGRLSDGSWREPFDPRAVSHQFIDNDFMESNSWQYTWHVMHDVKGLISLMGGQQKFVEKLDTLFEQPSVLTGIYAADVSGLIGQYAQGNQPSHHIAYLYAMAGKPWKTQARVREVMEKTYANHPDGIPGNDDGGQTSSWLLFSQLGFYPVNPASGIFIIGSPVFDQADIMVKKDRVFSIVTKNNKPKNKYIQSAKLNGKDYNKTWISYGDIMEGGVLELTMGENPNVNWGLEDLSSIL